MNIRTKIGLAMMTSGLVLALGAAATGDSESTAYADARCSTGRLHISSMYVDGTKNSASVVAPIMPPMMPVPIECRALAPAPDASTSGIAPRAGTRKPIRLMIGSDCGPALVASRSSQAICEPCHAF